MGTPILQGRDFGTQEVPGAPVTVIINRTFLNRYLAGKDPIGLQFAAGYPNPDTANMFTIVGVVDDIRQESVEREAQPAFYSSLTQAPIRRLTMIVATSLSDPAPLMDAIRTTVRKADPQIAVEFQQVKDIVGATISGSNSA